MKKLRVGLVGIGGMGYVHYSAYKNIPQAEVVAVCDVRTDMAKEKTKEDKVTVYADLDEILGSETLDVIDICTPSYMHADMIVKCVESHNVLCEKPMTLCKADADRVLAAVSKSKYKFAVAHVVRFMEPYKYLRKVTESKKHGKLLRLDMKRLSSIPLWSWEDWMRDEHKSGGVGLDLSIHDVDFVQSMLGKPEEVRSVYRPIVNNSTYILSTLRYGEATVTCEGTWYNAQIPFTAEYRAVFENGWLLYQNGVLCENGVQIDLHKSEAQEDTGINISGDDAYAAEIKYFCDCVLNNKTPDFITAESAAYSVELMEKLSAE